MTFTTVSHFPIQFVRIHLDRTHVSATLDIKKIKMVTVKRYHVRLDILVLCQPELSIIGTDPDAVQSLDFFLSRLMSGFRLDQIKTRFGSGLDLDKIKISVLK